MTKVPRIATVGLASWDILLPLAVYPRPGSYAVLDDVASLPGGTTTNTAVALAKLGADVSFAGMVGDDHFGTLMTRSLVAAGVDVRWLQRRDNQNTDTTYIVVSQHPTDRTILWRKGAKLAKGDRLDVPAIFGHDLVVLDLDDPPLIRFLTDLPAHTLPATRLLGTLVYTPEFTDADRLDVFLRFDALVGNAQEFQLLTGTDSLDDAIEAFRRGMVGSNARAAAISRGAFGGTIVTATERWDLPAFTVDVVDPTGAGDAFTAGIAWGMARRLPWIRTLQLANALGALATRALGAQSSLPTLAEVAELTCIPETEWLT